MMTSALPIFSPAQWNFLAVLEALETPVSIDIVGTIVPLPPVPLFNLIQEATQLHILEKTDGNIFSLTSNPPSHVVARLKAINTRSQVAALLDQLEKFGLLAHIDSTIIIKLLLQAKREGDAARIQLASLNKAIISQDVNTALTFLEQLLEKHDSVSENLASDNHLASTVLHLSDLCFANGKGFQRLLPLLQKTNSLAEALGDKRSQALIDMHTGRLCYLFGKYTEAFNLLSSGKLAVEAIGDEDMLTRAAAFIGFYYHVQGQYKKACPFFETSMGETRFEEDTFIDPFAPIFFSFSVLYHQFDRAFTMLDIFHRKAEQKKLSGATVILRAVLGYVLLRHRKEKEALSHLSIAQHMAREQGHELAIFWSNLFLTCHQFLIGNLSGARNFFAETLNVGAQVTLSPPYTQFPWISEMLLEFERQNIERVPNCSFERVANLVMNGPTTPSRGWVLRLLAKRNEINNGSLDKRRVDLENSLKFLEHTEFSVAIAKTRIDLARLALAEGNREEAQSHAQIGWKNLPAYAEDIFPHDLQHLIVNVAKGPFLKSFMSPEVLLNRFSEIVEKIIPVSDLKVLFSRLVTVTNWFFSAERSGLFLFEENKIKEAPQLLAAVNLTEIEAASETFDPRLKQMIKAVRSGSPILKKILIREGPSPGSKAVRMLCFPFQLEKGRQCVLYHENSDLGDGFDYLENRALSLLGTYIESSCRGIWEYCLATQRKTDRIREETAGRANTVTKTVIGQSSVFLDVLNKARRIATADFPILIQGETGVGKEIMAHWIHQNSPRHEGPYVIIDSTTIAENLMESEFFGYEKGAFTGADGQKPGRVELANDGTLFLDEVGELPLSIQAKLLRVLEEKTFTRVGGSRVHQSNFRLIAATNRNLAKEVQAGRFREDLFYRLNVLPLQIPPLRERKEDIVPFARHFLEISCKRLKRPSPPITPVDVSALLTYPWPGNIRELKNIIERAALLSSDNELELQLVAVTKHQPVQAFEDMPAMTELQRRYIAHVLAATGGRISGPGGAADILRMKRTTLYARMKKLGMPTHAEVTASAVFVPITSAPDNNDH